MKLVYVSLRALRADERKSLQGIAHFCQEMKTGLAIVSLRHMAHQAQDFALLVDDDRSVLLGPKIKPADLDFGERADGRD